MNCAQSPQDMKLISFEQHYTGSNSSIGGVIIQNCFSNWMECRQLSG